MITIKISEIEVDKIELMKIWDGHNVINRNLDNIISDFNYMNANTIYEVPEKTDELMTNLTNEKMKYLNAHICGTLCAISPDSQFNKNHVGDEDQKQVEEKTKSNDFAKSLLL